MPARATTTLAARVFRGMLWSYASLAGVRLLVLVSTAVLAHLLSPRDFGLVALALIFTTLFDAIRDLGLNQALVVAHRDELADYAATAFTVSVLLGIILALIVAAISPLAADFFHQPRLLALLAVLGLNLPLRSLGLTHYGLAQRELNFRSRTLPELGEVIVRGALGIVLALRGAGPWSLVVGYLGGTAAWTVGVWTMVAWRPSVRLRIGELRTLIRFGGGLTVVVIIGTAMSYVDNLFVGKVLGPTALGEYSFGFRLPELLIIDVVAAAGLVLFPAFATLDRAQLRRAVIVGSRYALLLGLPIGVALIVLADPLVLALFGQRWHDAAPVVRILSIGFVGWPLGQIASSAYQATKRVDVMLKLAVPQGLLLVASIAIFVRHGIAAVAACQAVVRVVFVVIGVYVSTRILEIRPRELLGAAWPAVVGSGAMAAVMVLLQQVISSPWLTVAICSAVGGTVYVGLVWLLAGDAMPALWKLIASGAKAHQVGGA